MKEIEKKKVLTNQHNFRIALAIAGKKQGEVARAVSRTDGWISRVLNENLPVKYSLASDIASCLGVEVGHIFFDDGLSSDAISTHSKSNYPVSRTKCTGSLDFRSRSKGILFDAS